jgi:hypothetical protein
MKRLSSALILSFGLACLSGAVARADVKTQEKGHVKFEGALGRVVNFFGGKAAREGIVSTVAVGGDRKATLNDASGQIIDLGEEKVYDLDLKKKTYKVTTFEEVRRRIQEARERAEKEAAEADGDTREEPAERGRELEMDFDVKETGAKKDLAGYSTRQVVVTITVREKGKTLEESGGLVLTTDSWLAPTIAALKEVQEFDARYARQIDSAAAGASAEQLAAAMAMFPGLQEAMKRMQDEGSRLDGTPLESTMRVESVKSPDQMAQNQEESSGGGLGGMLARRLKKTREQSPRSTILTINHQVLSVSTTVAAEDLQIPAGFKERS